MRDFFGKLGLMDPRPIGVEAMARQSNVDVKDRREAVLSLLRRERDVALVYVGRSQPQVIQKLRSRLHAGDQQVISRPGASDIEQVPLGVVNFFQIGVVADGFDAFL